MPLTYFLIRILRACLIASSRRSSAFPLSFVDGTNLTACGDDASYSDRLASRQCEPDVIDDCANPDRDQSAVLFIVLDHHRGEQRGSGGVSLV
jgi:hypothetical protein